MRRLCSEGKVYKTVDKRYVNYNIFNTMDNSMRFYLIPVSIDLLDPTPIDSVLCVLLLPFVFSSSILEKKLSRYCILSTR